MAPEPEPSLTIFAQNKIGGVQFFYDNLVRTGAFDAWDVRYLVCDQEEDPDAKLPASLGGAPTTAFHYSALDNGHHTLRRLARELPAQAGVALANWDLELACLDTHRRPDLTVIHLCHDEFYVDVAVRHAHVIDAFVAHNPYFVERLRSQLPVSRSDDVHFLPFGIRQDPQVRRAPADGRPLNVVYIGRLARIKGALELPAIDDRLRALGVAVRWTVLGRGPDQGELERAIAGRGNFTIRSPYDGASMLRLAAEGDVMVLPSRLDGTPLAVMEAMSVGLVPIVSEFNPGAHWLVPPEVGFVCPVEPTAIAGLVARLDADRSELETRSEVALRRAREEFEVGKKARAYAEFLSHWRELKRPASAPARPYGSRLDAAWIPNPVSVGLRRLNRWRHTAR